MSFEKGSVPSDLKMALIIPLLKKLGLDLEISKNFHPVSNLPNLSKLLERVATKRLLITCFSTTYFKFSNQPTRNVIPLIQHWSGYKVIYLLPSMKRNVF